ncbi:hypothetical protein [Ulvibacterium sp.]|uniref:hypothetical protein n=1 Tax=Ulvibacterium sp. TaxID=2665914 RepID=UPI002615D399|nr:hypothetical protein [Ulvibacterium sp.]
MEAKKYLEDITEIKNMMSRSSRFISLSGLSGIMAGIYALIGAFIAKLLLDNHLQSIKNHQDSAKAGLYEIIETSDLIFNLLLIASSVALLAIVTGFILTNRKAKKSGEDIWNASSRRLVLNFLIPLMAGGLFCLVLLQYGYVGLVASATLIFYGLACVNASKYTLGDIRYLGIANIIIGLIATQFIGYGLYFWALGFGVFHIIYGTLMYFKHDKK